MKSWETIVKEATSKDYYVVAEIAGCSAKNVQSVAYDKRGDNYNLQKIFTAFLVAKKLIQRKYRVKGRRFFAPGERRKQWNRNKGLGTSVVEKLLLQYKIDINPMTVKVLEILMSYGEKGVTRADILKQLKSVDPLARESALASIVRTFQARRLIAIPPVAKIRFQSDVVRGRPKQRIYFHPLKGFKK